MNTRKRFALLLGALSTFPALAMAAEIELGGFFKTSLFYSVYHDGDMPAASAARDFYYPAAIPVGGDASRSLDFSIKESRIALKLSESLDELSLDGSIAMDFIVPMQGNEIVSNSYNPRIREAYFRLTDVKSRGIVAGQLWSGFHNIAAWPETLDFTGPAEGIAFARQPLLGVFTGPWQFAIENSESWNAGEADPADSIAGNSRWPDVSLHYQGEQFFVAGLLRQLASAEGQTTMAAGLSVSGVHALDDDNDIRWMATAGKGIGRYVGHGFTRDAIILADGSLEAVDVHAAYVSIRHAWNPDFRSSLVISHVEAEVPEMSTELNREGSSLHANLLWNLGPSLLTGIEVMHGRRRRGDGHKGRQSRLIFSMKYRF